MRSLHRGASALTRTGTTTRTDQPAGRRHVGQIAGAAITAMLAAILVPGASEPASADVGGGSIVTSPGAAKGFPEFYDDGNDKLRLCTKGPQCMVVGSIPEYFWYGATAVGGDPVEDPNKNLKVYLAGIEGTYVNFSLIPPNSPPGTLPPKTPVVVPGDEVGFNRLRFRVVNLVVGQSYKITHPYGVNTFVATVPKGGGGGTGGEINVTLDNGCVVEPPVDMRPCDWGLVSKNFMGDYTQGRTAFLRQTNAQPGYLGDILVPGHVTGAPSGTNAVIVEGPNAGVGGPDPNKLTVTNFGVQGQILYPGTPSTPDLVSASDTGSSSTDNITNATQPTFEGTTDGFEGTTEVEVKLLVDGATTPDVSKTTVGGKYSIALTTALAPGLHNVVAKVGDLKESSPLTFTVDTVAPTMNTHIPAADAVNVSQSGDLTASFTENVLGVDGAAFTLRNNVTGAVVAAAVGYDATTRVATLNPTATLALATGYTATLSSGLSDMAGNPFASMSWSFTTGGAGFTGMTPTRVLNTLNGTGAPKAKLGAARTLTLTVPGLPDGTTAVAINVMVTNPTAKSYLTVYPGGTGRPGASNLNFEAGQTIPNLVMVPLGPGNTITFYNMYGTVNVLADLVGYYKPGVGAGFTGMTPTRVLNTLNGTGAPNAKLGAARTLTLTVPGLPDGTTAVAINVMVTNPTAKSYLTVYPGGTGRPGASNLNFEAGQTIPNLVLVPLGPGNTITFYNMYGTVNVLADLVGYYW